MLRSEPEKIYIEHCINCYQHTWCTSHDENKYKECFSRCKDSILRICSNVNVCENIVPLGLEHNFLIIPGISRPGKPHFPRLGSFEVYFRGKCIFSKLDSMRWPPVSEIANKIKQIQESPERFSKKPKNFPDAKPKSQKPVKKRLKKTAIKPQKINGPKDLTHEKLENLIKNHQKKRTKRFSDLFNKQKSRSSSVGKESDLEVFVETYPEKNKEGLVKGSKDRLQKEELKEFFGEIKNEGQRMAEEAKGKHNLKNEFSEKLKNNENSLFNSSRSSEESSSEDEDSEEIYKETNEENKQEWDKALKNDSQESINNRSGSEQNLDQKKSISKNSSDESQYKEDDNFNSDSEKSDKKEKISKQSSKISKNEDSKIISGLEDHNEDKTSEKDQYEENFEENSSENEKSSQKSEEKYSKGSNLSKNLSKTSSQQSESKNSSKSKSLKSDSNSEKYSEFDKKSSSSKKSSESEKFEKNEEEEQNYSEDNQEENQQEFEDTHPLRPINKSFQINLKVGIESRKKINFENKSENDSKFVIKSSNPLLMSFKDEVLHINKGIKEKIQLIFASVFSECEKKFYLYIDKDDEEWECLEIVVNYTN